MESLDLSTLRRTAAEIAAAAIYETYPNVELWGGGETSIGFYYDFHVPHSIHSQLIEEKMRQIVRERRPIRTLEMVSFSAQELLKDLGHIARAEELGRGAGKGLAEIIRIGSFHDLSPGPHLKNSAELAAFKISIEPLPEKGMRINGWCHFSKGELRKFLKKLAAYVDPFKLGEQKGLWRGPIWLPEGLKVLRELIYFLTKEWFVDAYEISSPLDADRVVLHRSLGKPKVAEIWNLASRETQMQVSFFGKSEGEVISSLQSIGKTLTILGFDHFAVSKGQETDYLVEDGLGRSHPIVQVKRVSSRRAASVDFYFTVIVEKILFLLLEKNLVMDKLENQ